jgi:hypothetical protein
MAGTVTVACKLPNGLILKLWQMVDTMEPVMGGGMREVKIARPHPDGRTVVLNGNRVAFGVQPGFEITHSFGLTHNVDRDFFEEWMRQNADLPLVRNKLIFAYEDPNKARDQARELAGIKTLMEPIDPDDLASDERVRAIGTRAVRIEKATNT